jgi:hypothetical protein
MKCLSTQVLVSVMSALCCGAAPVLAEVLEEVNDQNPIHRVIAPFNVFAPLLTTDQEDKEAQNAIMPSQPDLLAPPSAASSPKLLKPVSSGLGWRKRETYHDWMLRLNASPLVWQFDKVLREAGRASQVDPLLLKAMIAVESSYMPNAVPPRGALGLMQIMPDTADFYATAAERQRPASERMIEPRTNVLTGARVLADLLRRFQRIDHALAAWNAGEAAVRKSGGLPPIHQTQRHVTKIMELYWAFLRHHAASGGAHFESSHERQAPPQKPEFAKKQPSSDVSR